MLQVRRNMNDDPANGCGGLELCEGGFGSCNRSKLRILLVSVTFRQSLQVRFFCLDSVQQLQMRSHFDFADFRDE